VSAIRREYSRAGAYSGRTEYSNGELWYSVQGSATTDDRGRYVIDRVHAGEASWILAQAAPRDANWAMSDAPADPRARKQTLVPTYYPKSLSREGAVPVVVHSLEHRENVDVRMARAPSYCLEATLTAGGTPAKMRFGIEDAGTYPVLQSYNALWPQTPGVSGDDGRIRVCDLNPGRFQLTAARSVAPSRNPDYSGSTPVTISDGDVLGVKVATFPPVTIHASVVWDGSPPNGSASPSFSVGLWPTPLGPSRATTSIPGEFSPEAAPVTHYSFLIYDLAPPLYIKDITYGDASILHKSFVPGSVGGSGALRVVIGRNGGSLNAKVADDDGHPVADCWVVALPASAQTEAEAATSVVVGQTDVAGSFAFAGLPPGNYSVFATTYALPAKFTTANPPVPTLTKTPEILNKFLQARPRGKEVDIGPGGAVQVMLTPKSLD
jgi:hypothetical protein